MFRRGLGVVFQDHRLLMDRPVFDNVALPLIVTDTAFREIEKRVRAALDQVGLLGKERVAPLELSVGEQQRVCIARAIVSKPPLLLADEPTGNLDAVLAAEVMGLFRRFNEVGVTVVVATHDLHLVRETGLREIVLADVMPDAIKNGHHRAGRAGQATRVPAGTTEPLPAPRALLSPGGSVTGFGHGERNSGSIANCDFR